MFWLLSFCDFLRFSYCVKFMDESVGYFERFDGYL